MAFIYTQQLINSPNFLFEVAKGNVAGHSILHKFGEAPDFDNTDNAVTIWDGANDGGANQMAYQYSSTADIDSIVSSNAGDTQDITIYGLDGNYNLQSETVTLTGQTRKALAKTYVRIYRMENANSTDNAGVIYCYVNSSITDGVPDDPTKIRAIIGIANNQTLMSVYTIPASYTGFLKLFDGSISGANKTTNYRLDLRVRPNGKVFNLKHRSSYSETGSSRGPRDYAGMFEKIDAKSDIELRVTALSAATGAAFSGWFDILLVQNQYL